MNPSPTRVAEFFLGLDFGTSGARAAVLDEAGHLIFELRADYADTANPQPWRQALFDLIGGLPAEIRCGLSALAIDGTSGTLLATDSRFEPVSSALPYNDGRAVEESKEIAALLPPCQRGWPGGPGDFVVTVESPTPPLYQGGPEDTPLSKGVVSLRTGGFSTEGEIPPAPPLSRGVPSPYGPTSGLAKRLWLARYLPVAAFCFHQADWLLALLTGKPGITDYHNALKSGYDVEAMQWPDWVTRLPGGHWQQTVLTPGEAIGTVSQESAKRFGLNPACTVRAGTTDSIAAFLASGANAPGDAVTSLGTTLVLKLLSETRVDDSASGVYSHRFGKLWLAGGASNTGGGVLRQFFSNEELIAFSANIDPDTPSGLDYYPLPKPGERFPSNDPNLEPCMEPRPKDDAAFLHGLLEGMAKIESKGYRKLEALGASPLKRVLTAGGGAQNETWQRIRQNLLGVPVTAAIHAEAAHGTAQLARLGKNLLPV